MIWGSGTVRDLIEDVIMVSDNKNLVDSVLDDDCINYVIEQLINEYRRPLVCTYDYEMRIDIRDCLDAPMSTFTTYSLQHMLYFAQSYTIKWCAKQIKELKK